MSTETDITGRTILHVASEYSYSMVKALLKKKVGGDVNARDSYGNTPLMYAAKSGNISTIQTLVDAGASVQEVNDRKENPLHFFVKNNKVTMDQCAQVIGYFAEFGLNGYSRDKIDNTPAHTAMLYSNCTALEYLVSKQYFQLETANMYVYVYYYKTISVKNINVNE